jgi:hypothetical protein
MNEAQSPKQERGERKPNDRLLEHPHDELELCPANRAKGAPERHRPRPSRRAFSSRSFHRWVGLGNASETPGARHGRPPTSAPQAWFS